MRERAKARNADTGCAQGAARDEKLGEARMERLEPSGRNQWQPVANGPSLKTAEISQNRCRRLRPVAADLDGKEGVDPPTQQKLQPTLSVA
jgi:hypothetical protein